MKLLADTSALLALVLRDDRHHAAAAAFARQSPTLRFVMSELVLSELATRLRVRAGAARAAHVCRELIRGQRYELVFADAILLAGAFDKMERFADKRLSLTDCLSFELIERLGLSGAFSFDADFRDCGFRMFPHMG